MNCHFFTLLKCHLVTNFQTLFYENLSYIIYITYSYIWCFIRICSIDLELWSSEYNQFNFNDPVYKLPRCFCYTFTEDFILKIRPKILRNITQEKESSIHNDTTSFNLPKLWVELHDGYERLNKYQNNNKI